MDHWATTTTHRIGKNIAAVRKRKNMTAQTLADRCTELGVAMKRTSIANLENERRDSVTVTDLIVIAAALDVPPVTLIYPTAQAGEPIEMVGGTTATTFDALSWFSGTAALTPGEADEDVALIQNLQGIRSAESQARRYLRQGENEYTDDEFRETMARHAVAALGHALPYRSVCERLLTTPLPIPDDLADLYVRAELERSSTPGVL
ncbi:helix-turn-helix domain-containing protein [Kocuria sp. UCD-OTCP]|uniref:helix-turn-helix domain-containing protein n=1 Tax=Kocuria sp. UCD-OTCP TaxID=1292021 RepID=UPI00036DDF72|nr:helix-turn-helix transcriptional regulator [Kocuria sp. UCD-OTCP]EYT53522.1 DNA-binding protein [Kocuria sp. UCD-OTCP]